MMMIFQANFSQSHQGKAAEIATLIKGEWTHFLLRVYMV